MDKSQELMDLTRRLIDLKIEKKKYNTDMNESIKEIEAEIKKLVKE